MLTSSCVVGNAVTVVSFFRIPWSIVHWTVGGLMVLTGTPFPNDVTFFCGKHWTYSPDDLDLFPVSGSPLCVTEIIEEAAVFDEMQVWNCISFCLFEARCGGKMRAQQSLITTDTARLIVKVWRFGDRCVETFTFKFRTHLEVLWLTLS